MFRFGILDMHVHDFCNMYALKNSPHIKEWDPLAFSASPCSCEECPWPVKSVLRHHWKHIRFGGPTPASRPVEKGFGAAGTVM